jgi:hypothetical protein
MHLNKIKKWCIRYCTILVKTSLDKLKTMHIEDVNKLFPSAYNILDIVLDLRGRWSEN